MRLVTGSKNFSSWTMRAWLVMRSFSIPFDEVKIALNQPDTQESIARHSPSGRIPCLVLHDQVVWDSMSICEYLAERCPDQALWPSDARLRTHARSICFEMHAGFLALRQALPLDICAREIGAGAKAMDNADVNRDVRRIEQIWAQCLAQSGGPFLFGAFSIADAYFAPVVLRFRTYGLPVFPTPVAAYMDAIEHLSAVREWVDAAAVEQHAAASAENATSIIIAG